MRLTSTTIQIAAFALAAFASLARADDLTLTDSSGKAPGQEFPNVTISRIDGEDLVYRTAGGQERRQPLARIFAIRVTNDAALTPAEFAYRNSDWNTAIDNYVKVVRAGEPWKVRYVLPRLLESAQKANRFDAVLVGVIGLARVDPSAAASIKPTLPPKGSKFLDDAARDLNTAIVAARSDPEKTALLTLLLDIQLTRGDQAAAEAVVEQLLKLTNARGVDDPTLAGLVAEIRLGQARVAVEARRYADAAAAIEAASPRLNEPRQQAEALYLSAEAKLGLAAENKPAKLDAALAFMRVVAHFGSAEGRPFVAESLLRASEILESSGHAADARSLCEQVVAEFPGTSFSTEAARRIARLTDSR